MLNENGKRKHSRVRDDIPVHWTIGGRGLQGRGILRNLSLSGAMLETKSLIAAEQGLIISLKSVESVESVLVPSLARMVWGKGAKGGYFFYGLEFSRIDAESLKAITLRVEDKLRSISFGFGGGLSDTSVWFS